MLYVEVSAAGLSWLKHFENSVIYVAKSFVSTL